MRLPQGPDAASGIALQSEHPSSARSPRGVALFDLDRTIVRRDTAGLFVRYEMETGRVGPLRVARVAWWRGLYTLGTLRFEQVVARTLRWYSGRDVAELEATVDAWFQTRVARLIMPLALEAIQYHTARGDLVAMVSASSQFVCDRVAREVGIPHVICSQIEVVGSTLSGRLAGPLCFGEGKLGLAREFLEQNGRSLAEAVFYTDSITDLPLIEEVAEPRLVNPDPRLRRLAAKRGWKVLRW